MTNKLIQHSVVVAANTNNPTILNPDFLRTEKIIPEGWELKSPPITTLPYSRINYSNRVSIVSEPEKFQVVDAGNRDPLQSEIVEIVRNYLTKVPHVPYSSVGVNFQGIIAVSEETFLMDQFLKDGPWNAGNQLKNIGLRFAYPLENGQVTISLDKLISAEEEHVVLANANFHRAISSESKKKSPTQIKDHLKKVNKYWSTFNAYLKDLFSNEIKWDFDA